ncbi:hypothetical protein AB4Z50_34140 [Paenibacillus sp. 2TAB26]
MITGNDNTTTFGSGPRDRLPLFIEVTGSNAMKQSHNFRHLYYNC